MKATTSNGCPSPPSTGSVQAERCRPAFRRTEPATARAFPPWSQVQNPANSTVRAWPRPRRGPKFLALDPRSQPRKTTEALHSQGFSIGETGFEPATARPPATPNQCYSLCLKASEAFYRDLRRLRFAQFGPRFGPRRRTGDPRPCGPTATGAVARCRSGRTRCSDPATLCLG